MAGMKVYPVGIARPHLSFTSSALVDFLHYAVDQRLVVRRDSMDVVFTFKLSYGEVRMLVRALESSVSLSNSSFYVASSCDDLVEVVVPLSAWLFYITYLRNEYLPF